MSRISADHLARRACVYIRQSTPDQVQHNQSNTIWKANGANTPWSTMHTRWAGKTLM